MFGAVFNAECQLFERQYTKSFFWRKSFFLSIFMKIRLYVECEYSNFIVSVRACLLPIFSTANLKVGMTRLGPIFCVDLSRVFLQGATTPPTP